MLKSEMMSTWLILYAIVLILSLEFQPCSCICQRVLSVSQGVFPEGQLFFPYSNISNTQLGTEHLIYCVDETYKAQELEFGLRGESVTPSIEVNTTTIAYRINETQKGVFSYYCLNKVTKKICTTRVTVDSAPAPVTDFACKSFNLEVLNCSWTNPVTYCVINYSLTMTFDDDFYVACHPEKVAKTRYCAWNTTSQPRYRQLVKQFHINLKFSNFFGSNEQNYNINHYSIIKPDPPINLKVIGNGTHSVYLQWSIPNNMVDFLPKSGLEHKMEYQIPKIDGTSFFRAVNTSELPPLNKTYKFLLKDLPYANKQYGVRIYIRPKEAVKDEYWSDFTYGVFHTESETSGIPDTSSIPDTFKDDSCDISRDLISFPVRLDHDAAGKSSVKVTWRMACTIQDGIITGYLITYCPVKDASDVCDPSFGKSIVNVTDPKRMEITITNLKPFRTYQMNISINTIYGEKPIENVSTRVTTTEDTPSSPRNVIISEIESNSIVISWDPPLEKNGIIEKYVIYNYTDEYAFDQVPFKDNDSMKRRSLKLEGLIAYNEYSWSVVACNIAIDSCSQKSPPEGMIVKTRIGSPSKLKSPTFSPNSDSINWLKPEHPGGNINLYQILKVNNENREIFNTTNLSHLLNNCQEDSRYQVRAVNTESISSSQNGVQKLEYPGEWSDPLTVTCDVKEVSIVLYIVSALAGITVVIVVVYELISLYIRKLGTKRI